MGYPPVVVVESGGVPRTQVAEGASAPAFTVVESGARPITLADNAPPIALFNPDGSHWEAYSDEAEALFARFTTPPTTERKGLINDLIVALKDGGVWSKLDILWLIGADSQASTRNWVQDAFNLTAMNSPTFTVDRHFASDGTTSYLEAGFNLSSASGRKYLQNSASLGVWCAANSQSGAADIGTTNAIVLVRNTSDAMLARANTTANVSIASTLTSIGMFQVSRTGATAQRARNGAGVFGSDATASQTPDNVDMRFLGRAGTFIQYAPHPQAAGYVGSGMTDADMDLIAETLTTYLSAIGAA